METLTEPEVFKSTKNKNIVFRISNLPKWNDCPTRCAANVIRKELTEMGYVFPEYVNGVSSAIGTGSHAGIKAYLEAMKTEAAKVTDAVEAGINAYNSEVEKGIEYDATSPDGNTAETQIKAIVNAYIFGIVPTIESDPNDIVLEKRLEATIPGHNIGGIQYGFTLSGHPDIVETKIKRVRDIKTGKNAQTNHSQLGGYSLLCKAMGETIPETCAIDHIPRNKKGCGEPQVYSYEAGLCESEARNVVTIATYQLARFLSSEKLECLPNNTASMLCSSKYCSAYGTDFCPVSKTLR